jgi:hypothetical protein
MEARIKEFFGADFDPGQTQSKPGKQKLRRGLLMRWSTSRTNSVRCTSRL